MSYSWDMVKPSPYIRYRLVGLDKPPSFPEEELPGKSIPHEEWDDFWEQICALARTRAWIDRYCDLYIKVRNAACLIYVIGATAMFLRAHQGSENKISDIFTLYSVTSLGYSVVAIWRLVILYMLESRVRIYQLHAICSVCRHFQESWLSLYGVRLECEYEPTQRAVRPWSEEWGLCDVASLHWIHLPRAGGIYLYLYPSRQHYARIIRCPVHNGFVHGMLQPKLQADSSTKTALQELDQTYSSSTWDDWVDMTRKLQAHIDQMAQKCRRAVLAFLCIVLGAPKADITFLLIATLVPIIPFRDAVDRMKLLAVSLTGMVIACAVTCAVASSALPSVAIAFFISCSWQIDSYHVDKEWFRDAIASDIALLGSISFDQNGYRMLRMEYQQVYRFDWLVGLYISHVAVLVLPPPACIKRDDKSQR